MKKLFIVLALVVVTVLVVRRVTAPTGPDLTVTGDEVVLATGDLDVRFSKGELFDDTFMLFGGGFIDHKNAIANVTLAGLSVRDAQPIQRRYPDFHRCASPGAALAKDKVVQLDMVPANGPTLTLLRSSLEDFEDNIRSGGDRVCVHLKGSRLRLTSAEVREVGESVADRLQSMQFYLVDSANRVGCVEALGET